VFIATRGPCHSLLMFSIFYVGQYENEVNLIPMFSVRCCPGVKPSYGSLKTVLVSTRLFSIANSWSNRFFLKLVLRVGKIEPRLALSLS